MSSTTPEPGDLLVSLRPMRTWHDAGRRDGDGVTVPVGTHALVLATWLEGRQRRLHVVCSGRVALFSCADHTVGRNWALRCGG